MRSSPNRGGLNGDKPPLEFVCLFLYILYFLSHYIDNPPSEFVCLFLYILYFPHTMATTLPGICLSRFFAFFTFLSQRQKNQKLLASLKNIKIIIMLIEHT
jgi:hypothetical protein